MGRYRGEIVMVAERQREEFTMDTPMGPLPVYYGRGHYSSGPLRENETGPGRDMFSITYRGEVYTGESIEPTADENPERSGWYKSLRRSIEKAEAEFQAKKKAAQVRKDAAKTPLPAMLVPPKAGLGRKRDGWDTDHIRFEEIHVRGIDQRNGNALILRANGDKESVSPAEVLRVLDRDEQVDLTALIRAEVEAKAARDRAQPPHITSVLKARGIEEIDLTVHLDRATMERVTTYDGREFRGPNDEALSFAIWRHLLEAEYPLLEVSTRTLGDWDDAAKERIRAFTALYHDRAEFDRKQEAEAAHKAARAATAAGFAEYVFDLTLFSGLTDEPEKPADEESVAVPAGVHAPSVKPDWED